MFLRILLLTALIGLPSMRGHSAPTWWTDYGAQELTPSASRPSKAGDSLTLLAPINGVASGQIAMQNSAPIKKLAAQVSELSGKPGALTASAIKVRFLTNQSLVEESAEPAPTAALTTITSAFISTASALGVVYLTAEIPPGTAAGDYSGSVTVTSDEGEIAVPLTVRVADFVMPARSDLDLWITLMQSPAQLAYFYKVAPYSEAHWKVIEASTRLLGDMGHHVLFVPVLWHANVGSGPQMIVFRREGDSLKPDFSRLERYFQKIARECGPQRLLVLGVWGRWLANAEEPRVHLTRLGADGGLEPLEWSGNYAANEAMWREVYDGVAALAKKYLAVEPEQVVLGFADDLHPSEEVDAFWQKIAPRSPGWDAWTHNYGAKGPRPAFFQIVDTAPPESVQELLASPAPMEPVIENGVAKAPFYISSCRDIQNSRSPAVLYYSLPDLATTPQKTGHSAGFSRIGLDFWKKPIPLVDGTISEGDGYARDGSDARVHPARVVRNYRGFLTAPGPDGAAPLIHFDALREGVQAAQARLTVVRAINAKPDLRAELLPVLELQMQSGARHAVVKTARGDALADVSLDTIQEGWEPLFNAAGRAQHLLGVRERDEASAKAEIARRAGPVSSPERSKSE